MTSEDDQLRIAPVHKSLIRPQLMFGCDRKLVFILLMATALLAGPGGLGSGNVRNIAIGVALFIIGVRLLAALAKTDPDAFEVFRRSMQYRAEYPAVSGVRAKDKKYRFSL